MHTVNLIHVLQYLILIWFRTLPIRNICTPKWHVTLKENFSLHRCVHSLPNSLCSERLFCMCWVHSLSDSGSLWRLTCMCQVYSLTDSLSLGRLACVECYQCLTIITWGDLFACVECTHRPTLRTRETYLHVLVKIMMELFLLASVYLSRMCTR